MIPSCPDGTGSLSPETIKDVGFMIGGITTLASGQLAEWSVTRQDSCGTPRESILDCRCAGQRLDDIEWLLSTEKASF
jgi:hypothetical protein